MMTARIVILLHIRRCFIPGGDRFGKKHWLHMAMASPVTEFLLFVLL